jgi:hypothetical protein
MSPLKWVVSLPRGGRLRVRFLEPTGRGWILKEVPPAVFVHRVKDVEKM